MIDFNGDVWQTLQIAITAKCCKQDQNDQTHRGDYLLKGERAPDSESTSFSKSPPRLLDFLLFM